MVKDAVPSITQPVVAQFNEPSKPITQPVAAQLNTYNFTLPIKHLDWTHNLILLQQVKDIRARYWYMVQSITSHWNKRYLQEAIKLDHYGKHGALANISVFCFARPKTASKPNMPYVIFRNR